MDEKSKTRKSIENQGQMMEKHYRQRYAVELHNVYKSFGSDSILKGITHRFERGCIHGIIGMNGSGKTVLLKCICGFLRPTKGHIVVNGQRVGKDTDFPPSIGLILETPGFLPNLSGFQNLYRLAKLNHQISATEVRKAMEAVGLDSSTKKAVKSYSLGMRERLGIAQAIMEQPDLLVLDEPFNGLDKIGVKEVCHLLQTYKTKEKTILLAAHNFAELRMLCDTITELDGGKIVNHERRASE